MKIGSNFFDIEGDSGESSPVAIFYVYRVDAGYKVSTFNEVKGNLILNGHTEGFPNLSAYKTALYVPNAGNWIKLLTFDSIPVYNHSKTST